jgi:hypothetical protein
MENSVYPKNYSAAEIVKWTRVTKAAGIAAR